MSKLPDGPKIPKWLQLIYWIADPLKYLDQCVERYGDTFTIRLSGLRELVILSHPQAIQEVLTAPPSQFKSGERNKLLQPLVGETSMTLLDGQPHQRQRKLLIPPFHGQRINSYSQLICDITQQVASQWVIGQAFTARTAMQDITIQVIMQGVFGLGEGTRYQKLKLLLAAMLEVTASPLRSSMLFFKFLQRDLGAWSPWGKMLRRRQQIYNLLQEEINQRREQPELMGNDILSLMMSTRDENGELMSDQELQDQLMTLLFAGHETTASALAWAFYWIHRLPTVRQKLLEEIDSLGDHPDPMAIAQLPYLTAVCQETLRIYPVALVIFARITTAPITIMGHHYQANTALFACPYLTHHREDLYPDSDQFKPERFLERQYSAYEYFPFGGGNRRCIGATLAMLEMKLVLAKVLSDYHLALAQDKIIKPARRGVAIAPENGVPMVMTGQRVAKDSPKPATVNSI
ncbi:cytochrome P450 [Moorena producens JHB]|uniref:Cytochrome P450 n=1 Tax=Moorena producens (strain JHB) TaxID=1454205 RepID=A0A1D9G3N6_MOOP1|nr:cytochrome P450 [Moorena producens]AOY82252.1 cytochrome P450 [Moorena producens JHB]